MGYLTTAYTIRDEGSISIEWLFEQFRIGISIETDIDESCWYFVSKPEVGGIMTSGLLLNNDC
ncbi:MAG: hypothetical protein MUO60_17815 [Clostridiaceae bacterium]|nr:hypothetical protein [Clostridiaceae bacterium]